MKKQKSIKSLFMSQRIIALSCLVFLFLFFSCFGKNFLTKNSMVSLLESVYYIICLAFGMTFVISTGGIDLSIGSVAMCGALIGGVSYNEWHMPIWAALIITVLVTTVFGVLNGFLVSCCKIPPFVATMGTQYLAQGIGYIVSRVQTMRYPVVTSPDGWFKRVFYEASATGILSATSDGLDLDRTNGKYKDLIVIGFDSGSTLNNAVRSGYFYGAVAQDPYTMGYEAMMMAINVLQGGEASDIVIPAVWFDASNMDDPEISRILYD